MTDLSSLTVDLGARSYPIHIGSGLLQQANVLKGVESDNRPVFIIYDEAVTVHVAKLEKALKPSALSLKTKALKGGEQAKSFAIFEEILNWLLAEKVDRSAILFAVGGGVMGDLCGFAASTILRGIDYVQVPTTLLSMVDSAVGGKTGINTSYGKNLVGSFYQPKAVLADIETLTTLPERELKAGYAEVVKYGLIDDPAFFDWLEDHRQDVFDLKPDALKHIILTSCQHKARIVGVDETEQGMRALLNLGHTFGHALEAIAGYDGSLLHGEAIAIGMVLAHRLSERMGLSSNNASRAVERHFQQAGLPTAITLTHDVDAIMEAMTRDKKAKGGKITFVLTKGIGQAFLSSDVAMDDVKQILLEALA